MDRFELLSQPLSFGVLDSEREIRKKPHFFIQQVFTEAGTGLRTPEVNKSPALEGHHVAGDAEWWGELSSVLSTLSFQNVPLALSTSLHL